MKWPDAATRVKVSQLSGIEAVRAGAKAAGEGTFVFDGQSLAIGGPGHRELMHEACWAKFTQHEDARRALLGTGSRPLMHQMRQDSVTIPGALMAQIWMDIRSRLSAQDTTICYFARDRATFGFLSHFELSVIVLDGEAWPTAEHYYQAQKSFDPAYRNAIRQEASPSVVKMLAAMPKIGVRRPGLS